MADEGKQKRQRGRYCVAGVRNRVSCTNRTFTGRIRMHQFPTEPIVRAKWVKFVRKHRPDFKDPTSKYAALCSAHFEESCYVKSLAVIAEMEAMGIRMNAVLRRDAVPTRDSIFPPAPQEFSERTKRQVRFHFFHLVVCMQGFA